MSKTLKVRCIDNGTSKPGQTAVGAELVLNQVYDALEVGAYGVKLAGFEGLFNADRFLVENPTPPARIPTPREAWFDMYLTNDKQARKEAPLARGLFGYFPNACLHVAHVSFVANAQHNPGEPMQWAVGKSQDEPDCELRHMLDAMGASAFDDDGLLHKAKKAWRAIADLERDILARYPNAQPGASVTGFERKADK